VARVYNNPVVLVVEDDPSVRELLEDVLRDEGYQVVVAHDGVTALQVITTLKVDLISLDLDLPGLSGSELLQVLRARNIATPPVIVVTSHTPVERALKEIADAVLGKPFDIDDLLAEVIRLLPRDLPKAEARLKQRRRQRRLGGEDSDDAA
jgi:DNA-binding response OmpR family regulator